MLSAIASLMPVARCAFVTWSMCRCSPPGFHKTPSVDVIAILCLVAALISLYQQIVGRGLRLYPGKTECLILDYAGNGYDLYSPEVGQTKLDAGSQPVQVFCSVCGFVNLCVWQNRRRRHGYRTL